MSNQVAAFIHFGEGSEPRLTVAVENKVAPMEHHKRGLQWTTSGYGSKIPTERMVKYEGRWRRVYCAQYSNVGTFYVVMQGRKHSVVFI